MNRESGLCDRDPEGAQTVTCYAENYLKEACTTIAAVDSNGKKSLLLRIGKGQTKPCL
jgi:hypothetical protein